MNFDFYNNNHYELYKVDGMIVQLETKLICFSLLLLSA